MSERKSKPFNKISDLAGTWNISDEELEKINEPLDEGWKTYAHALRKSHPNKNKE